MNKRGRLGQSGEDAAAAFLTDLGFRILSRNWRCARGEIDIIAQDDQTLVFVEVKARSSLAAGHPLEAITPAKLAKLRFLVGEWCRIHLPRVPHLRIDAVGVLMTDGRAVITHVPGITR